MKGRMTGKKDGRRPYRGARPRGGLCRLELILGLAVVLLAGAVGYMVWRAWNML